MRPREGRREGEERGRRGMKEWDQLRDSKVLLSPRMRWRESLQSSLPLEMKPGHVKKIDR